MFRIWGLRTLGILAIGAGTLLGVLSLIDLAVRLWMLLVALPLIGIGVMLILFSLRERITAANVENALRFRHEAAKGRICPYCGTENGTDGHFCKSCGAPLS